MRIIELAGVALLLVGCSAPSTPVPVRGSVEPLVGEWVGDYQSQETGRSDRTGHLHRQPARADAEVQPRGDVGLDIVAALSMTAALVFGEELAACVVALMYAGGLAVMRYSSTPMSLELGAGVLMGFGLSGCSFNLVLSAFSKLLPPERRGIALGAGTAAGSFGQFLFAPFGLLGQAITIPGNPAPDPRSTQRLAPGAKRSNCAQSSAWRVQ